MDITFRLNGLRWKRDRGDGAICEAEFWLPDLRKRVWIHVAPAAEPDNWVLVGGVRYSGVAVPAMEGQALAQAMVNLAAKALRTVNMWPGEQQGSNGKLMVNQFVVPDDVPHVLSTHRAATPPTPHILENMWDRIRERLEFDGALRIEGFSRNEVLSALSALEPHFDHRWVKKNFPRVRRNTHGSEYRHAGDKYPAYHLAHLATGALCTDPGVSMLVDIGMSVIEIADVPGAKRMVDQIRAVQIMLQISLAANLHRRGLLIEVEHPTGVGKARHDLAIRIDDSEVDIEMKVRVTGWIEQAISDDLATLAKQVPANPSRAVALYVMLQGDNEHESRSLLRQLADDTVAAMPSVVSAVVIGSAFMDARGGRTQREVHAIAQNPGAIRPISADALCEALTSTIDPPLYPQTGATTLFSTN